MSSVAKTCRSGVRVAVRQARSHGASRGFTSASKAMAAQNFKMPALSPTMTEGNISSWKLKEGDTFAAGDVILEVETDKATMDVEAQDDGILAKIMQGDGSKQVAVGTRIAVLAEPGDDLSTLAIPADEPTTSPKETKQDTPSPSSEEAPPTSRPESDKKSATAPSDKAAAEADSKKSSSEQKQPEKSEKKATGKKASKGQNKKYPLYPSVAVLIHQHNIPVEELTASGPSGRLLKGDVLAYLDKIPQAYPNELSEKISKRSHLDLSDIKKAPERVAKKDTAPTAEAAKKTGPPPPVSVTTPISMVNVLKVQRKLQETLGVSLPLSTFVARAVDLANQGLPLSKGTEPTADELFDAVIGAHNVRSKATRTSRGHYMPQVIALQSPSMASRQTTASRRSTQQRDVLDDLLGVKRSTVGNVGLRRTSGVANAISGDQNIFSLSVDERERARARVFLGRMKTVLEKDPGTLIL